MKAKLFVLLTSFGMIGCGASPLLKDFPENDLLEAAISSQRIESEMTLKMQICHAYAPQEMGSKMEAIEFQRELGRAYNYYEDQTRAFNKKVRRYLRDYQDQYLAEPELRERANNAHFQLNLLPARLAAAEYFGVDSKDVKEALSQDNQLTYFSRLNPNSEIIMQALHEKDKAVASKCEKLMQDFLDDKIQPDFSKYGDEYKKITGMNGLSKNG